MGVAIVGFAAYRDEQGKLLTFKYIISLPTIANTNWLLHSFSTKDEREESFKQEHSQDIDEFLNKWGTWVAERGKLAVFITFNLQSHFFGSRSW